MEAFFDAQYGGVENQASDARRRFGPSNARKTHCKHGHPFSGDNLKITKLGLRHCKACACLYQARHRAAKKRLGSTSSLMTKADPELQRFLPQGAFAFATLFLLERRSVDITRSVQSSSEQGAPSMARSCSAKSASRG